MAGLEPRLRALESVVEPAPQETTRANVRARMRAFLDEIAAAKREGRAPSAEAQAISEAIERRRARES